MVVLEHVAIPKEPVMHITIGLVTVLILVLVLPFRVKKIEENLEPFFLVMGIIAATISGIWSKELIISALEAPVMIGGLPIGIFQVVLIVGLLIYFFHDNLYTSLIKLQQKIGLTAFVFLLVAVLGLISSIISVIVAAVILAEVVAATPIERSKKIELTVLTCFSVGIGAALTPVGEPLSTIAIAKLNADFFYLLRLLGIYIIPGIFAIAIYAALRVGKAVEGMTMEIPEYTETLRTVIVRAIKVYVFVAALILLGEGFTPLIVWYFTKIPPEILYWINTISAVLDNATLTAAEIGPALTEYQIRSALMGLTIAGGMLIPGNIPNIVAAGRLKITMKEWAKIGVPVGFTIMLIYFFLVHAEFLVTLI